MEINCLPFNEKQFLLGIDAFLFEKYGEERRFILIHRFDPVNLELVEYIPDLKCESRNALIKKYLSEWFREAATRGFLEKHGSEAYVLNEAGFNQVQKYKAPIASFLKEHWKWQCGTTIALLALYVAYLGIPAK